MAEIDDVTTWLNANQDKKGTPEYGTRLARLRELYTAPQQATVEIGSPEVVTGDAQPANWNELVRKYTPEQIRPTIEASFPPGARRERAYTDWANAHVAREGTGGPGDYIRSFARGAPGGSWADELNALTYGVGNRLGLTDKSGEEVLAYNRARDRAFDKSNPWASTGMQFAGAAAAPYLRGAGFGRNVAYNTALGGVQGAGEGETPQDRFGGGVTNAALGGFGSMLFGPTGAYLDRYRQSNVTPEIVDAANRLAIDLPYFVRAANPIAQAEGRRAAQTRVGSPANLGFEAMQGGYGRAGEGIVQRATGALPATAPYAAGQAIEPAMERAGRGATAAMGTIAQQIEAMLPAAARGDPAELRNLLQRLITLRTEAGHTNPTAGLEQAISLATQPGGASWRGLSRFATELGDQIGERTIVPGPVPTRDLRALYAGVQGTDRPNMIEAAAGAPARAAFEAGTRRQAELAQLRDQIEAAIGNRTPEQLVQLVQNAASTKGGPTNLNQLALILQNMSAAERQQVGGGVLGNIINKAQVRGPAGTVTNPGAVATGVGAITPQGQAALFPAGTQLGGDVDALRLLGERIAAVDRYAGRGSVASLGERMAMPTTAAGGGMLGALAHSLNMPPQVTWPMAALSATALASQGLKTATVPYFAQHGVNDLLAGGVNRLGYGGVRTAADQFAPAFRPKQQPIIEQ